DFRGKRTPFGIKPEDRSRHIYVIGKTGMGKSTMLENMAIQDIQNGHGIAFIDPHGSTAEKLLDYVPEARIRDVIYFAPFDLDHPISFNVMEDVGKDQRHLVASGLMSTFKKIWVDAWSARMEYILTNTILALLEYPGSTLLGVNRMLADKDFRKKVVDNVSDPSVKSFWVDEFAKYTERQAAEAVPAIQNKVGQFTANPLIRNIIGQSKSSFDFRQMMDERKILIVNLSKGLLGETNANLLGSMLITKIYLTAMSRANAGNAELKTLPQFYFFVDEFQSFANESFANILSEARKYKLSLTIAHQYIEQMSEEVRAAVFGNVGSIISFRVGPFDAEVLEKVFSPTFLQENIVNLGKYQMYLTLMIDGVGSPPFSAIGMGPIQLSTPSLKEEIIKSSRTLWAKPRLKVEADTLAWYGAKDFDSLGAPVKRETVKVFKTPVESVAPAKPVSPSPIIRRVQPATPPIAPNISKETVFIPKPKTMVPLNFLKSKIPEKSKTGSEKSRADLRASLEAMMKEEKEAKKIETKPEVKEIPKDMLENMLGVK
ncbi:MAG: type IV secretory system conjugative DNA transfer family protein, partial [Patescibacteria group bacterium]